MVSDCIYSTVVSLGVVALFIFCQLRLQSFSAILTILCIICACVGVVGSSLSPFSYLSLFQVACLGWVIGLLEGVILVLVVGLSFDYTLHYGACIGTEGESL